jgi:hypothetical protein
VSRGIQAFRLTEVKRAARALQAAGIKISRITFEDGKFEFITKESEAQKKPETAAERWLREQAAKP